MNRTNAHSPDHLDIPSGIALQHLAPTLGTEVYGIDLRNDLDRNTLSFLRRLWLNRKVLFFREQNLTREQHIKFGRCFGELLTYPTGSDLQAYPELYVFDHVGTAGHSAENFWHMDTAMNVRPVAGCISLLRKAPSVGGDTLFADMTAAYDALSPSLKERLAPLRAVQRIEGSRRYYPQTDKKTYTDGSKIFPPVTMPLIQTHPETGRKILYACPIWTSDIVGLPRDESDSLLQFLFTQARIPEFQCRLKWDLDVVTFWDNRSVQHYACYDYFGQSRRLERVAFLGDLDWTGVRRLDEES
jgi:taurine dioxygenase